MDPEDITVVAITEFPDLVGIIPLPQWAAECTTDLPWVVSGIIVPLVTEAAAAACCL